MTQVKINNINAILLSILTIGTCFSISLHVFFFFFLYNGKNLCLWHLRKFTCGFVTRKCVFFHPNMLGLERY